MNIAGSAEIRIWETEFSSLPENIRTIFTPEETAVYHDGARSLIRRFEDTKEPRLIQLKEVFEDDYPMRAYIESLFAHPEVWFGLDNVGQKHEIRVRLPSPGVHRPLVNLPQRLKQIFGSIGGLSSSTPHFGRLIEPTNLAEAGKAQDSLEYVAMHYGNGDYLCIDGEGKTRGFDHETNTFCDVDLDECLDAFFSELCEPVNWREVLNKEGRKKS